MWSAAPEVNLSRLPTECPGCGESLEATRLTCPGCAMQLEGKFELPALLQLSREDLEFVLAFVRCAGSIKEMCALRGQSHPTVRNKLNEIIEKLSAADDDRDKKRRRILDAIADGSMTVAEATRKLKELGT